MSTNPRQKFQDLLTGFSHGMLVTKTPTGELHARPMALAEITEHGDLWFATGRDSPKVEEITADEHVCVTFQDGSHYVTVIGTAQAVRDRAKIDQLWSDAWKVWYPQGKDDPNLVLLKVTADTGEYWDNSSVEGLKYLFRAGKALVTGDRISIDPDQHQKVAL
jgi:general stress protein 26